ncbi:MAG: hypothetical protein ABJH70_19310 [Nitratireductor sp.]
MTRTLTRDEREELELLLPWYAAGTLEEDERRRVEIALEADPDLADSLALVRQDRDAALELIAKEAVPASMAARFEAALNATPHPVETRQAAPARSTREGPLVRFGAWLSQILSPPRLAVAAMAAALLIAVHAGLLVSLIGPGEDGNGFTVASEEDDSAQAAGLAVLVQFAPGLDMAALATFLDGAGGRIVDGPLPGDMFKLRFAEAADQDALAARLRAEPALFALVLPSE